MSLSFYLFFCTYSFFFILISSFRDLDQSLSFYIFLLPFMVNSSFFLSRSWSNHLPPQASSSSFSSHGQIIYPPQAPISTIRTIRIKTHQHHKNQNPQAWTPSTHKHQSLPLAPIHKHQNPFLLTHKH